MNTYEAIETFTKDPERVYIKRDIHGETIMQLTSQGNIKFTKYSLSGKFIEDINTGINIFDYWKRESSIL